MPNNKKRKIDDFKNKIKRKMRKLERMLDISNSESDSSKSEDSVSSSSDESQDSTQAVINTNMADTIENSLENILGSHPDEETTKGPEIAVDLAKRWESVLSSRLDKDVRQKLMDKWQAPQNCQGLNAPKLNPEVQSIISATDAKKDKFLQNIQDLMGKGITALVVAISLVLPQRETVSPEATQAMVDAGKLLTDMFHTISNHRKYQINNNFNVNVQKISHQQKIDKYLF
ncbi:unnamed protein product [Psylliodes chrysocephalus]|uniref:Uncharacterized protein n=1 Tax=Psylliodes chrysocephalus TaxID=3402493 RepID=A0A9P0CM98_9CUCU|nr:unnamed protein product [Psylliodes chrysocephala]